MTEYHFKDLRAQTTWICVFVVSAMILSLVNLCDDLYITRLVQGVIDHDAARTRLLQAQGHGLATLQNLANGILIVLWIVNIVLFCAWLYRATRNARALGARGFESSPGWVVGYFFIPFANLVMGYRGVRELWLSSHAPSDWSADGRAPLVLAWWLIYLLAGMTSRVSSMMLGNVGHDIHALVHASVVETTGMALFLVAAGLYLRMIRQISRVQREQHGRPSLQIDATMLADMPSA